MQFTAGQRSDVCLFVNNWDRGDCWGLDDFLFQSHCFSHNYMFSRHFTWGDESSVNSSYGHWKSNI